MNIIQQNYKLTILQKKTIKQVSKKSALLVGINYTNMPNQLYGCINDVHNVGKLLTQKGYTCTLLTDLTPIRATKKNILNAFKQLFGNRVDANNKHPNSECVILGRRFQSLLVNGRENSRINARGRIPIHFITMLRLELFGFNFKIETVFGSL